MKAMVACLICWCPLKEIEVGEEGAVGAVGAMLDAKSKDSMGSSDSNESMVRSKSNVGLEERKSSAAGDASDASGLVIGKASCEMDIVG